MSNHELRDTLSVRQEELKHRLAALNKDLQKTHSADWSEQAQERENDEVLESLAQECSLELQQLNSALKKIDEGTYGLCSSCGCAIDPARLIALPAAQHCVKCAT